MSISELTEQLVSLGYVQSTRCDDSHLYFSRVRSDIEHSFHVHLSDGKIRSASASVTNRSLTGSDCQPLIEKVLADDFQVREAGMNFSGSTLDEEGSAL